jgi:hypothetical protein
MKKKLLLIGFSLVSACAFASANFTITDALASDVTGSTQTYWISNAGIDSRVYSVVNNSSSSVTVKVLKTIILLNDPGATMYFCTDQNCYSPTQNLSLATTMTAGGAFDLTTDLNPNGVAGIAQVRYTVINQSNTSDTSYFEIVYNVTNGPAGVKNNVTAKPSLADPMPNPASSVFSMDYKLGNSGAPAKLVIYNMLGENVLETSVTDSEGTIRLDVSGLEAGVYFCSLESAGKVFATRRVVVSH